MRPLRKVALFLINLKSDILFYMFEYQEFDVSLDLKIITIF